MESVQTLLLADQLEISILISPELIMDSSKYGSLTSHFKKIARFGVKSVNALPIKLTDQHLQLILLSKHSLIVWSNLTRPFLL
jgi:hypothetical protein